MRGVWLAAALAASLAACTSEPTAAGARESIAGTYMLLRVEGASPCCADPDSAGGTVTVVAGSLFLDRAPAETYVLTPAGPTIARSCVQQVPNGAFVDSARVVHLPDGSSYALPRCGTAPYRLVLVRRHVAADGSSRIVADSTTGLYTWGSSGFAGADTLVTLVDAGLSGPVSTSATGPVLRIARTHVGPPALWPPERAYVFGPMGLD